MATATPASETTGPPARKAGPAPAKVPAAPSLKVAQPQPEDEPPGDDEPGQPDMASPQPNSSTPVKVDLQARLADRYPEVSFAGTPLVAAVRLMSRISTLPIALDLDAMADVGAGPRDPITVRRKNASTGEILGEIAAQRGLAMAVLNDRVVLTLPHEKRSGLREEKYDLSDLLGGQPSAGSELVAAIRKLVAPGSWRQAGGQGTVGLVGGSLTVQQSESVHRLLRLFCRNLRMARELSVTDADPAHPKGTRRA